ncbi:hypothetical protein [Olsenella sp. Marseille-P4559]|uniref:hypothetical protein n=1 Tax=Olsenella sp. Marseille-P4559 TaxID=2364795 RepID=UPI00102F43EC|nr:hypothetical protein [Olsenella sp. Marseille-P4559]
MTPYIYVAHDPLAMTEAQVTEFDQSLLAQAHDAGIVFIRQDINGNREIVEYTDVVPPEAAEGGDVSLVKPEYVDDRLQAVIDVFDALKAVMFPATGTTTASDGTHTASGGTQTKPRRAARKVTPEAAFETALAALKEIVQGGEEE